MMDCGPAALTSILHMHGIRVSYESVRTLCAAEIDGTSLDDLEQAAAQLGLALEQHIVPEETLFLPGSNFLPAIVMLTQEGGGNHFVVLNHHGRGQNVWMMDPSTGRRLVTQNLVRSQIYLADLEADVTAWMEWAQSDDAIRPLTHRARKLVGAMRARALIKLTLASHNGSWRKLGALDAALRFAADISEHTSSKSDLYRLVEDLVTQTSEDHSPIPEIYWRVFPVDDSTIAVRGAMVLSVEGRTTAQAGLLSRARRNPMRELRGRVLRMMGGWRPLGVLCSSALGSALALAIEAVIFRAVLELGGQLQAGRQRFGLVVAMLALVAVNALFALSLARISRRLGRQLEGRFRLELFTKIPLLPVRYFQTRPVSDMADRAHGVAAVRGIPGVVSEYARLAGETITTILAIAILAPWSWWVLVIAGFVALIMLPSLVLPVVTERTLRIRTLIGTLMSYHLGAMEGVRAVRAHRAERAMRRAHGQTLQTWRESQTSLFHFASRMDIVVAGLMTIIAIVLAVQYLEHRPNGSGLLLLVFWAMTLPTLVRRLILLTLGSAEIEAAVARADDPIRAQIEDTALPEERISDKPIVLDAPVSIQAEDLVVRRGANEVLSNIRFDIPAGSHVAIVGASGAGKSTLIRLLLGWIEASEGTLRVNEKPYQGALVAALQNRTVWIDPDTYLWNRSLIANIRYGHGDERDVTEAVSSSGLIDTMSVLPQGFATQVGESGRRLSGGEGQRLRMSRGLMMNDPALVLLDEPFRGLPSNERTAFLQSIRTRWKGVTMLCATHDVDDTADFDWVLVVEDGKIVEQGSPAMLATQIDSRYAAMLSASLGMNAVLFASENNWRRWRLERGQVLEQED